MKPLAQNAFKLFGLRLTTSQLADFECYEQELLDWNQRFNLTAIQDPEQVRLKHFLDSLSCLSVIMEQPAERAHAERASATRVIDIGSGAGFPGIPMRIANPNIKLTLVESVKKKVDFCRHICEKLGLHDVEVIHDRVEIIGRSMDHRERYDWAVARAVAILPVLAEYLLPLVRNGGGMVAMKGESAPAESHSGDNAIRILGGRLRKIMPVVLPGVADERYLILVDKVAATPEKYPRRVGIPSKRPL